MAVCAPWLVPEWLPPIRMFVGLLAWLAISKLVEWARDRPRDPRTRTSRRAFLLWLSMPPKITWPLDDAQAAQNRRQGWRRAQRGLLKASALAALVALSMLWPALHERYVLQSLWGLWICYLVFSGAMDLGTSVPMLCGLHVADIFDRPFAATSPRDLWGKRWNLWFHGFVQREVFWPLRRRPQLALLATFVLSGVAHEYLVIAALGDTHGEMLAFFGLQGAYVWLNWRLERDAGRWPPLVGWALNLVFLILTAPLFLNPVLEAVPLHRLRDYL